MESVLSAERRSNSLLVLQQVLGSADVSDEGESDFQRRCEGDGDSGFQTVQSNGRAEGKNLPCDGQK